MRLLPLLAVFLLLGCRGEQDIVEREGGWLQRGSEEARDTLERSARLDGRPLILDVSAGSVSIVGTDESEARFRFERVARGSSVSAAQSRLARLRIDESGDQEGYTISAPIDLPGQGEVHILAHVPRTAAIRVVLGRGDVELSGLDGALDIAVRDGRIDAGGLAGTNVRLVTTRGRQNIQFSRLQQQGRLEVRSENGDLVITLPPAGGAEIVAATGVGSIAADLELTGRRFEERRSDVRFRGTLGDGSARLLVVTENGNITLQGPTEEEGDHPAPAPPGASAAPDVE